MQLLRCRQRLRVRGLALSWLEVCACRLTDNSFSFAFGGLMGSACRVSSGPESGFRRVVCQARQLAPGKHLNPCRKLRNWRRAGHGGMGTQGC